MSSRESRLSLALAAIGVVFGDIATSPLYAVRECFYGDFGIDVTRENILGVLSLMFWSLILVVSVKYLTFILNADNDGEGGVIALTSLVKRGRGGSPRNVRFLLVGTGLFAASLLYGDGMITPAISVMSALEGLENVTPAFTPYVIPATILTLVVLFLFQRHGTARVGTLFGPVVLCWLLLLATLGLRQLLRNPSVLASILPWHAVLFLVRNRLHGFLVLGAVFLVVTGTEALYADMGHFGREPIRLSWLVAVLPALLLNYFGQGALLLADPSAAKNPFYAMVPSTILIPVLILATCATIIASQAVITGAFSLTRQAIQLGYLPRLKVVHTSASRMGQIYVPSVNWLLMVATCTLVLAFRSSSKLAAAYGVAVTSTMLIASTLFYVVARERFEWSRLKAGSLVSLFLVVDLAFFAANVSKIMHGAWFPLAVGALVYVLLITWKQGRSILAKKMTERAVTLDEFRKSPATVEAVNVEGTALFPAGTPGIAPPALLHNLEHNHVIHKQVVLLHFTTTNTPRVPNAEKVTLAKLGSGFSQASISYGFMEKPNFDNLLSLLKGQSLTIDPDDFSVFLGRQKLLVGNAPGMAVWRKRLFIKMAESSEDAATYFNIPMDRVIEVGVPLHL